MPDMDHRLMTPPFLRVVSAKTTPSGDSVYLWDLRIGQANVSYVAMPTLHSMEHFLGDHFRAEDCGVVNVGLMGCQTGLYITTLGIGTFAEMAAVLSQALAPIPQARSVPLANDRECGWADNHSLAGAQALAAWLLRHRRELAATGEAREMVNGG